MKKLLLGMLLVLAATVAVSFAGSLSIDPAKLFVYESERLIPIPNDTTKVIDSIPFLNKGWRPRVDKSRNPGAYVLRITPHDSSSDTTQYSIHLNGYSPTGVLASEHLIDTVVVGQVGADVVLPIGIEYARYSYSGYVLDASGVDSGEHIMPKEMEVYRAVPMEFIYKK